jgi:hypothetical protein
MYFLEGSQSVPHLIYPVVLLQRDRWDDYGYKTTFSASILLDQNRLIEIGTVKVLHKSQTSGFTPLPVGLFPILGSDYCSLGQSLSYYQTVKQLGGNLYPAILEGLQDVVYNPAIVDDFVTNRGFRDSLERFGSSVRAISDAAPLFRIAQQREAGEKLSFRFRTAVGGPEFVIPFSFNDAAKIPGRINALIGYNGTGKTRLLGNLAQVAHADLKTRATTDFVARHGGFVDQHDLRFSSVMTVSYSAFDTFEVPGGRNQDEQDQLNQTGEVFGHVYSGLRAFSGPESHDADRLKTPNELADDFSAALSRTNRPERRGVTRDAIAQVLSEPSFLRLGVDLDSIYESNFMASIFPRMSTGHKIVLTIVLQLGAHLNPRSLVLMDEPESHLHPPLLTALLRGINGMLDAYDSFAVIATHSPVILQEIPCRYVYILRRFNNVTIVERPERETFGENVGFLTRNVFNLDSSATDYHAVLRDLAMEHTVERIEELFGNPLGAQARAYIESVRRAGGR